MESISAATEKGTVQARHDIATGHIYFYSGAPSRGWGLDLAKIFLDRFAIEVIFTSCLVTEDSIVFENGYNAEVKAFLDSSYGKDAFEAAMAEVERIRLENYQRYFESNPPVI